MFLTIYGYHINNYYHIWQVTRLKQNKEAMLSEINANAVAFAEKLKAETEVWDTFAPPSLSPVPQGLLL